MGVGGRREQRGKAGGARCVPWVVCREAGEAGGESTACGVAALVHHLGQQLERLVAVTGEQG